MTQETVAPVQGAERSTPPGPRGYPVLGVVPALARNPLRFFLQAALEHGGVVRLRLASSTAYLVTQPEGIKRILQDNSRNYIKGYDAARSLLGNGLVASDGEFWLRQRRLMQPAFNRPHIATFAPAMVQATQEMLERWERIARAGEALNVADEMMRLTQHIIVRTMFSTELDADSEEAARSFATVLEGLNRRLVTPIEVLHHLPTPTNRRFAAALQRLDRIVYGIIEDRRRSGRQETDLLGMLLAARDPDTGEGMSDRQLRDEVMTIFLAGHETTANTLSWTWFLLSLNPDAARRVHEEVTQVIGSRQPAVQDLGNLAYGRMVIDEALRLYPPAWMFARQAVADDEVAGYHIPAGRTIMLSPWVTHRHPAYWENAEGFDPERFTPERSAGRQRFAYFPFSGGPRVCIGEHFALQEAQLVLSMVAQRYYLDVVPGFAVEPQAMATLRPRSGLMMTIRGANTARR